MGGIPGSNTGHGHVWKRPDGVRMRCGGPGMCADCAADLVAQVASNLPFQKRVLNWLMACFSNEVCRDTTERNHRFLEEALELVQSTGCTASEAHQLVDYVFGRPVGDPFQEVGGVAITFAALCSCIDIDQDEAGEAELARISVPATMERVRAKQAAKPKHSPLPA